MSDIPRGAYSLEEAGEGVRSPATTGKRGPDKRKRKPGSGKPKPAALKQAEKDGRTQARIIKAQQADCRRLAKVIEEATPGTIDAKDIGALARATNLLHDMQRKSYDFGADGPQVKAVIVIPAGPAEMEAWQSAVGGLLGADTANPEPVKARVVEPDIQGPEPEEE